MDAKVVASDPITHIGLCVVSPEPNSSFTSRGSTERWVRCDSDVLPWIDARPLLVLLFLAGLMIDVTFCGWRCVIEFQEH